MPENNTEEKLDRPLVVHKKSDASYYENAAEVSMNATHTDEESADAPTLERHRFRKNKNKKKNPMLIFGAIVVICAFVVALVYADAFNFKPEETTEEESTRRSYTTEAVNDFKGTIVVKGTYIFFEGEEIDGINELERKIKYLDPGTKFVVKDEHADSAFLNDEVLLLLSRYEIDYGAVEHIASSGLMSKNETTTATTTTTTTEPATTEAETEAEE